MDPTGPRPRPTRMRSLALPAAALLLPLSLAACGSDDDGGDDIASDPAPTTATASPTPSPTSSPTAAPTVGTYPAFEPADYTYQLSVMCFCMGAGVPIEITVEDGEAVSGVYAVDAGDRGGDIHAGDPADQAFWLTINDVIDKANDTEAATVTVDWPDGQDYPSSVYVDGSERIADDENSWTIADVQVTG